MRRLARGETAAPAAAFHNRAGAVNGEGLTLQPAFAEERAGQACHFRFDRLRLRSDSAS